MESKGVHNKCTFTLYKEEMAGYDTCRSVDRIWYHRNDCCPRMLLESSCSPCYINFDIGISWVFSCLSILSLQNLVLGYECGRVIPAGKGRAHP